MLFPPPHLLFFEIFTYGEHFQNLLFGGKNCQNWHFWGDKFLNWHFIWKKIPPYHHIPPPALILSEIFTYVAGECQNDFHPILHLFKDLV